MANAAVNMSAQIPMPVPDFNVLWHLQKSKIHGSYKILFNFFVSLPDFLQGLYHFTFPPAVMHGPHFSKSSPRFVNLFSFFIIAIFMGVQLHTQDHIQKEILRLCHISVCTLNLFAWAVFCDQIPLSDRKGKGHRWPTLVSLHEM